MRAALLYGPQDLRVETIPDPVPKHGRTILVRVEAATTCGTDAKMWRHGHRVLGPYPCAFGHETAGVRTDTAERVLVSDSVACGACPPCRAGRAQICQNPDWVLGGFAEYIAAPEATLHPIPGDLPAPAAAMAEPLAAAVHAVDRGSDAAEVGIVGGGPMGLMLAALLIAQGRSVTLADPHPERRAQAAELGAAPAERLQRHALVFEAVGRPTAWRDAAEAASPGGVVVLVGGCPSGVEVSFDPGPLHYEELELRGAFHHDRSDVDRALAKLADGTVPWRLLLGPTISLDELQTALATPNDGPALKWVVDPRA